MRAIFYDTETTGLNPESDRIIEIAAFDSFHKKSFSRLINPNMPIPKEASQIHNITDDMVQDAPCFEEVGKEFLSFCGKDCVLIAHNNDKFDIHFLKKEFQRAEITMPSWPFIDSLKWAKKYRPDLPRHALQYLREIYNILQNQAHRALDDVMVLEQVFCKMIDDLSFDVVLDLMKKEKNFRMPFGKHRGKPLKDVPKNYVLWLLENKVFEKQENRELKKEFEKLGAF